MVALQGLTLNNFYIASDPACIGWNFGFYRATIHVAVRTDAPMTWADAGRRSAVSHGGGTPFAFACLSRRA